MSDNSLELIMLVGFPGTGKTTWVYDNGYYATFTHMILSTDNFIESVALGEGKSYNEVFNMAIKDAERHLGVCLDTAIEHKLSMIWDQTNLTPKSRRGKLSRVPKNYIRRAVVFDAPPNHQEWLDSRPGKNIPMHVVESMKSVYAPPTLEEGFDSIEYVRHGV